MKTKGKQQQQLCSSVCRRRPPVVVCSKRALIIKPPTKGMKKTKREPHLQHPHTLITYPRLERWRSRKGHSTVPASLPDARCSLRSSSLARLGLCPFLCRRLIIQTRRFFFFSLSWVEFAGPPPWFDDGKYQWFFLDAFVRLYTLVRHPFSIWVEELSFLWGFLEEFWFLN